MQSFNVWVSGAGGADGLHRDVKASKAAVAVKRIIGRTDVANPRVGAKIVVEVVRIS